MDNLWPNEDGNSWTYEWTRRIWDAPPLTTYGDPDSVPDVPSLDYVEGLLGEYTGEAEGDTTSNILRLEFDGICVSDMSGASGQCLDATAFYRLNGDIAQISFEDAFFGRLSQARPDLAPALAARHNDGAALLARYPTILHGGIFEKTAEYIGGYGDLDTELSWKYLESDISTGHEFVFQLIPSLASDVFLHCRILGRGTLETKYDTYRNAVECLYLIDYGIYETGLIDPMYGRAFDYGTITYAPGAGPVMSYERMLIDSSVPDGAGAGDSRLVLIGEGGD
jgi:hypothetical protein